MGWDGRVVRRCWVNFQCRGVLLISIIVGQRPIALAVGADGGCFDIFSLIYHFSFLSPSLWETARYRLKYCLKGPLSPKQPTNQPKWEFAVHLAVAFDVYDGAFFVLSFFTRNVLDEILDLIASASEGFCTDSFTLGLS